MFQILFELLSILVDLLSGSGVCFVGVVGVCVVSASVLSATSGGVPVSSGGVIVGVGVGTVVGTIVGTVVVAVVVFDTLEIVEMFDLTSSACVGVNVGVGCEGSIVTTGILVALWLLGVVVMIDTNNK